MNLTRRLGGRLCGCFPNGLLSERCLSLMTMSQGIDSRSSTDETVMSLRVFFPVLGMEGTCTITIDMTAMLRHEDDDF